MQHMLQHSELIGGGSEKQCCRFCYRQFSSPTQLQSHQEQVHGSATSSCKNHTCSNTLKMHFICYGMICLIVYMKNIWTRTQLRSSFRLRLSNVYI